MLLTLVNLKRSPLKKKLKRSKKKIKPSKKNNTNQSACDGLKTYKIKSMFRN